jgi:hypothetical protein
VGSSSDGALVLKLSVDGSQFSFSQARKFEIDGS